MRRFDFVNKCYTFSPETFQQISSTAMNLAIGSAIKCAESEKEIKCKCNYMPL